MLAQDVLAISLPDALTDAAAMLLLRAWRIASGP